MHSYLRLGAALIAVSSLSACATVIRGTKQDFEIVSVPPGADVSLSSGQTCVTPCKLELKRKTAFSATFKKDGYAPLEARVESKFNGAGALAGNVILGGFIGAGVDASNGSLNALTPNPLTVTLVPVSGAEQAVPVPEATPAPTAEATSAPAEPATPAAPPQF
jgi:hypothetical protein